MNDTDHLAPNIVEVVTGPQTSKWIKNNSGVQDKNQEEFKTQEENLTSRIKIQGSRSQAITINLSSYPEKETKAPNPRVLYEWQPKIHISLAQTRKPYSSLLSETHAYAKTTCKNIWKLCQGKKQLGHSNAKTNAWLNEQRC